MTETIKAPSPVTAYHVMTKPVGPICNLDCTYCFYLEKEQLFAPGEKFRMSDDLLERYIQQYIQGQKAPEITFAWQGGEPTLLGVDYFRKIVELQRKYADGRPLHNAIQTNGTLLDDPWCEFLAAEKFLVGLSIDGPAHLHDRYRVDKRKKPTFDRVLRGLNNLKKHGAEFNTLTVVNRANGEAPLEVYRFLKEIGSGFIQFIPLVERKPGPAEQALGLELGSPPSPMEEATEAVTTWSVGPEQYGRFLMTIFDEWIRQDVGRVFVQMFDVALGNWLGMGGGLCVFSETCGTAMALEHNGDLYSCDHYVYPRFKLGNILNRTIAEMVNDPQQVKFGQDKRDSLPEYCRSCEVRFACHGECPKHRFLRTPAGEPGLNYLCAGYKRFFNNVNPYMRAMGQLLRQGRPAAEVMEWVKRRDAAENPVGRNDPCPCGSGKKYKACCGVEGSKK